MVFFIYYSMVLSWAQGAWWGNHALPWGLAHNLAPTCPPSPRFPHPQAARPAHQALHEDG